MAREEKEATILSLSQEICIFLDDFQERLDNRFSRAITAEKCKSRAPTIPNVLDEIIEELEKDKAHLISIMVFISTYVLPKIN